MPSVFDQMIEQAMSAVNARNFGAANEICRRVLQSQPRSAPATLIQAICAMETGQSSLAIQLFRNALRLSPNDYVAMVRLPIVLRQAGQYREALEVAEAAYSLWPDDADVISNLGLCCLAERQVDRAVSMFRRAIALEPKVGALYHNLGTALELQLEDQLAAEAYRKAISLAPRAEESYSSLILLMLAHGNAVQTLEVCRQAIEQVPNSANFHLLYSRALREVFEKAEAERQLRIALALDPSKVAAAGFWMHEMGRFEEARVFFNQALEKNPDDYYAFIGISQGKKISVEDRELVARMTKLLDTGELKPAVRVSVHYALGKAYDDLKEYETAIGHFDEANRINYHINLAGRGFDIEKHREYLDEVMGTFSKEFIEGHRGLGSESDLPIFIVGMIRSGTTLTEQIISSHPEVGAAGEQKFWMAESPRVVDTPKGTLDEALLKQFERTYLEILKPFAPDLPHITDKMPLNFFWAGLMHIAFPNARIIHVRRSPIDNCLSIYVTALAKAPDFAYNKENIVAGYREYQRMMEHWRKVLPADRFLEIDYEDLVENPEPVIRKMIAFCGLSGAIYAFTMKATNDR